ncbi:MAG: helicase associated domain-containing protein [Casimicrobium sp.]
MLSEIAAWNRRFSALEKHVREAHSFETNAGNTLHAWIMEQREAGLQGRLAVDRRLRLTALGFLFTTNAAVLKQQTWDLHLDALKETVANRPQYEPPSRKTARVSALDRWVRRQQELRSAGLLDQARVRTLALAAPHLFTEKISK